MPKKLGKKIKQVRLDKKKKLKDISEATGLSISYLSQIERENSAVSTELIEKISAALGVPSSLFLDEPDLVRNYEHTCFYMDGQSMFYEKLSNSDATYWMNVIIITLFPTSQNQVNDMLFHSGEEFIYVLEGILTTNLDDKRYDMNPGDSLHFQASTPHSWENNTNKLVRFLSVYTNQDQVPYQTFIKTVLRGTVTDS